jgi:hypothetical protein
VNKSELAPAGPDAKSNRLTLGCFLSPLILLILFAVSTVQFNNFQLRQVANRFMAIEHPTNSASVALKTAVGLFGNGNHCDLFVAELRTFNSSKNAVRSSYTSTRVIVSNDNWTEALEDGRQAVEVVFLPSPLPASYKWKYSYVDEWDLSKWSGKTNLYIVTLLNSGENYAWNSLCDSRCN